MTNSSAVVVRRASHCQKTPHVSRPHSAPTTRVTPTNAVPISALAPASRSQPSEFDPATLPAPEQHHRRRDRGDHERHVGDPDRGHVHVQDAYGLGLVAIGRREAQAEGHEPEHRHDGQHAEDAGAARRRRRDQRDPRRRRRAPEPANQGWWWSSSSCHPQRVGFVAVVPCSSIVSRRSVIRR